MAEGSDHHQPAIQEPARAVDFVAVNRPTTAMGQSQMGTPTAFARRTDSGYRPCSRKPISLLPRGAQFASLCDMPYGLYS